MGQIVESDMAMMTEVLMELMPRIEFAMRMSLGWKRMLNLKLGSALVVGFGGSPRDY